MTKICDSNTRKFPYNWGLIQYQSLSTVQKRGIALAYREPLYVQNKLEATQY